MNPTLSCLMQAMVKYDCGDVPRVQHFVKVHDFAVTIAYSESMDEQSLYILEAASILHDIGIHPSEAKYGNCAGKHQEELGPAEARKVLSEVGGFNESQTDRICWLIAHHHTYEGVTSLDHRILLEADFLVNSYEDGLSRKDIETFRDKVFRTRTGISLLNFMWSFDYADKA